MHESLAKFWPRGTWSSWRERSPPAQRSTTLAWDATRYATSATPTPALAFNHANLDIQLLITQQAGEIGAAVSRSTDAAGQGAGDQGLMLGYATDETPELMPLPILLAHRIAACLAQDRKARAVAWLRPDAKTQVSIEYADGRPHRVATVVVSTMHAPGTSQRAIRNYVHRHLLPRALGKGWAKGIEVHVNPSGSFVNGGPSADAGVTGRKIIVDTYGGMARHGGGAFSGQDPSTGRVCLARSCRSLLPAGISLFLLLISARRGYSTAPRDT